MEVTLNKIRQSNVNISQLKLRRSKLRRKDTDFSLIKITWKNVRWNNADFLLIETKSVKARQNNVNFLRIKITSIKEQNASKRRGFFANRSYLENVRRNDVEIHQRFTFDVST